MARFALKEKKMINAVFIATLNRAVFCIKNNDLVFNVFIAIMQSIISKSIPTQIPPRMGGEWVVSNNTINNIYIIYTIRIRGLGCPIYYNNCTAINMH